MADTKVAFQAYTKGTGEMDGRTFVKILKDTKVLDSKAMTAVEADLIFTKVKPKSAKKIGFAEFEAALKLVAEKKKISLEQLGKQIAAGVSPQSVFCSLYLS